MNKSIKTIIALTVLFVIGFLALEGCNKKEARQPKVSGFFVSGCNDIVLYTDDPRGNDNPYIDTIYVTTVDDTKLKISTTNTPFFCGTDTIRHEINTQGQNISIALLYEDPWSDCLCGHHVDIILDDLTLGQTYSINLRKGDYDYFQFKVAFGTDTDLMFIRRM